MGKNVIGKSVAPVVKGFSACEVAKFPGDADALYEETVQSNYWVMVCVKAWSKRRKTFPIGMMSVHDVTKMVMLNESQLSCTILEASCYMYDWGGELSNRKLEESISPAFVLPLFFVLCKPFAWRTITASTVRRAPTSLARRTDGAPS